MCHPRSEGKQTMQHRDYYEQIRQLQSLLPVRLATIPDENGFNPSLD
jgi:hypothetical protein